MGYEHNLEIKSICYRIEAFDRNLNFGIPQQHETDDTKMDLPPPESYHDINSSTKLPSLTKQHIHLYYNE